MEIKTFSDKEVSFYLDNFCKIIKSNIAPKDLILFEQNFSTLTIQSKKVIIRSLIEKLFINGVTGATYRVDKNAITIYKNNFFTRAILNPYYLYHELLHAASSVYSLEDKFYCSGFSAFDQKKHKAMGDAINEGYTELLNNRFFNYQISNSGYRFEIIISSLIELLIGEIMTSSYFQARLDILIEEISEYGSVESTNDMIRMFDYLSVFGIRRMTTKIMKNDLEEIFEWSLSYLTSIYIKKLEEEIKNNLITEEEFFYQLKVFALKLREITVVENFMSYNDMDDSINNVLDKSNATRLLRELKR